MVFILSLFVLSLSRGFTGGVKMEESKQEKDDVINIFSVASGHLYERFLRYVCVCGFSKCFFVVIPQFVLSLRIMMLSVLKNTKTPVKFWFLKNYLSPAFKVVIKYKM